MVAFHIQTPNKVDIFGQTIAEFFTVISEEKCVNYVKSIEMMGSPFETVVTGP
jgi:hypothetical protein